MLRNLLALAVALEVGLQGAEGVRLAPPAGDLINEGTSLA